MCIILLNSMQSLFSVIKTRHFWLRAFFVTSVAYLVIFGINLVVLALWCGINMQTYPTDGTFQLYNPLRRMLAGQAPGGDFPFFHGIGVPYIHFLPYYILGHNLFAAETTKWLISPLLFFVVNGIFLFAFFRDTKKTVAGLAVIVGIASLWMFGSFYPSNSLISIRTTFPMLVAAALIWQTSRTLRIKYLPPLKLNILIATFLLAAAVLCGTEQGLAAIIAYLCIRSYHYVKDSSLSYKSKTLGLLLEAFLIGLFTLILLWLLSHGHVSQTLRYALIEVPGDQGWYFGGPPNLYLSFGNIITGLLHFEMIYMYPLLALGGFATYRILKHDLHPKLHPAIYFFLCYGLIVFIVSSTGYFLPSAHLIPLQRGLVLIAVIAFVIWLYDEKSKVRLTKKALLVITTAFLALLTCWSIVRTVAMDPVEVAKKSIIARHSDDFYPLSNEWRKDVNDILPAIPINATIWSTYTGVFDSIRGQLNPSSGGEDYIIHALGDERRATYVNDFAKQKPDYVITMRPAFFVYEEWLWAQNWSFYKELFTHYKVVKLSDMHVLWRHDKMLEPDTRPYTKVSVQNNQWKLPDNNSDKPQLFEVKIGYAASANLGIGQLDRIPRYLVNTDKGGITVCPVSLPSTKNTFVFPLIVAAHSNETIVNAAAKGILPTSSLNINSVELRELPLPGSTRDLFYDNTQSPPEIKIYKVNCNQH